MSQTEVQLIKDAVIVNADVSNSAAIDVSKISGVMPLAGGTFTDDVTFTGASANVVFDKSANAFEFADNAKAIFGTGSDLSIYHDGTDSFISNLTGGLKILGDTIRLKGKSVDENMLVASANGAVELYHDNSKKFETFASGVRAANDGHIKTASDSGKFMAGASDDLQLFHDGSNSFLTNTSSGGFLHIRSVSGINLQDEGGNENFLKCIDNGAVELYHDNSKKFETASYGVSTDGVININGTGDKILIADDGKIAFGGGTDLTIYHNGSHSVIQNDTGTLFSLADNVTFKNNANSETLATFTANSSVELYHDNTKRFETTSDGVSVTGTLTSDKATFNDDGSGEPIVHIRTDDANPWAFVINNDGSANDTTSGLKWYVANNGDGIHQIRGSSAFENYFITTSNSSSSETAFKINTSRGVELYYQNAKKLDTTSTGVGLHGLSLATQNHVLYYNSSTGQVSYEALAGGKILQVKQVIKTDKFATSSQSYTDVTGLSLSITPSSSSSKILFMSAVNFGAGQTGQHNFYLVKRGSTTITNQAQSIRSNDSSMIFSYSTFILDSPNTTSATTYKIQVKAENNEVFVNRNGSNNDYGESSIVLMEVAA